MTEENTWVSSRRMGAGTLLVCLRGYGARTRPAPHDRSQGAWTKPQALPTPSPPRQSPCLACRGGPSGGAGEARPPDTPRGRCGAARAAAAVAVAAVVR